MGEELRRLAAAKDAWLLRGDHQEARQIAQEVLQRAREAEQPQVIADALRSLALCEQSRAHSACYKESSERKVILLEAEKLCREALPEMAARNERRGEALMLLGAAEMLLESKRLPETRRGNKKRSEARASLEKALYVFQELQDKALEAEAYLALSGACLAQNDPKEALRFARQSEDLCRGEAEASLRPRALNACAVAIGLGPTSKEFFDAGLKCHQQAVEMYRQRPGYQRPLAIQCLALSKWYLLMDRARDALAPAKESLKLFTELGGLSADWRQEALSQLCRVRLSLADVKGAQKMAQEAEATCGHDQRLKLLAMETKVLVNMELDTLYEGGNLGEALAAAREGLQLAKDLKDKKCEASMLHHVAQACLRLRRMDDALEAVTSSSTTLDDLGEQSQRCLVLQTAIEILMAKGDLRAALEVCQEIRRLAQDLGKRSREANAILTEAQIYHAAGNCSQALALARDAQVIFQAVDDKKGEGMSWSIISEIQKSTGEKEDALRACRSTRALYQQAGDKRSQAYAMKNSAALFVANSSDEEAVREAHEALALARAAGDSKAEVEMLNLVAQATLNSIIKRSQEMSDDDAIAYITVHEDSAVRPAREAAALARKMGDKQMTGIATYSVAQCHAVAGRTGAAVQAATEARNLFHETWDRQGEAMAILMLGESLVLDGQTDDGKRVSKEAQEMFQSINDQEGVDKAEKTLQQIQEILGAPAAPTAREAEHVPQAESVAVVAKKATLGREEAIRISKAVVMESIGGDEEVTLDDPLMESGLDSLATIAFRESLESQTNIKLSSTLVMDYPTLNDIVEHLVENSYV